MRLRKRSLPKPVRFKAFGVGVELQLEAPELRAAVDEMLPPGHEPCDESEVLGAFGIRGTEIEGYDVVTGPFPSMTHQSRDVALGALDAQIRMFIATNTKDFVFVHSGVVAIGGGSLVIPGESFSGKTTLVRALVEAGATYYSDEYAVLDVDGRVHPYARRLSVRTESGQTVEHHVRELGGSAGTVSADVAGVLVTRYRPEAEWEPRRLSPGEAVIALMASTVPAQERPRETLKALSRAVAGATFLVESERSEADALAPLLLDELGAAVRRKSSEAATREPGVTRG